ncbi:MAG TPA: hypothetical protein VL326_34835 [Kofleriaceae bacterium]|jgi:hypothetical protein|nr:hypothetical protein [Kofleriaceae bacterium]
MGSFKRQFRLPDPRTSSVLLASGAIIGLTFGGWHTYRARRDSKQVEMTCDEYLMDPPESHWVKLTNCEYDLEHFAYKKRSSRVEMAYLRVKPSGDKGKVPIVVRREDAETLALVEAAVDDREPSEAVGAAARKKLEQPIEGIVTSGLDLDESDKGELASLKLDLGKDFIVIDTSAKPRLWFGILLLVASVLGLTASIVLFLVDRRRRRVGAKPAPAGA